METIISIVIPCYNSEKTIESVVDEVMETLSGKYEYEIILVNDGSTIELWNIIKKLVDSYAPKVKGIKFSKNFGQHAALLAGYRTAKGDVVIQMDDDGQCDPKGIPVLLSKIEEGYDVVFARYKETKKSGFRRWGSEFNRRMCISLVGMPSNLHPTSFSAARRYVVDEIIKYDKPYPYMGGLFFRTTTNVCDVEITHRERTYGESNYSLKKLFRLWTNGFTAFSVKPLKVSLIMGAVIALIGFVFAAVIIIQRLLGIYALPGWSSIISLQLILSGVLMLMLGISGEYLGRMYICLNNAPQYVISETYEKKDLKDND